MRFVLNRNRDKAMIDAIDAIGGSGKLAQSLGITAQSIAGWKRVPALKVREVSRITGVPAHKLRPDIYSDPDASA